MPTQPFSIRLPLATRERLTGQARRLTLTPRSLARRYVEEGARMADHPRVRFADGTSGRVAVVAGQCEVWAVIASILLNCDDQRAAAAELGLSDLDVTAAVDYFGEFSEEIDLLLEDFLRDRAERRASGADPGLAAIARQRNRT